MYRTECPSKQVLTRNVSTLINKKDFFSFALKFQGKMEDYSRPYPKSNYKWHIPVFNINEKQCLRDNYLPQQKLASTTSLIFTVERAKQSITTPPSLHLQFQTQDQLLFQ